MFDLKNKTAFITGGAQGLGRSIAVTMAKAGADIIIAQRDVRKVDAVIDEIKSLGRQVLAVKVDVTELSSVEDGVYQAFEEFPSIDILVNNAGRTENDKGNITLDDFDRCYYLSGSKGYSRLLKE